MGAIAAAKEGDIVVEAQMLNRGMLADTRGVRRGVWLDVESELVCILNHRMGSTVRSIEPQLSLRAAAQQFIPDR
jgi:hypothetical protein